MGPWVEGWGPAFPFVSALDGLGGSALEGSGAKPIVEPVGAVPLRLLGDGLIEL